MSSMSEKEYYQLTMSINKALNPMESPLKMKHARSAIITTHRTKECQSFWKVIMRQHLMENRFTAWKFCHLLHKVLREGHPNAIKHSQTHKKMILEMGKLWGHLQDGVGNCIHAYSKLLVTKLEFHEKNFFFPGSLIIEFSEVEKYINDDINLYFEVGVEIFDYLDDIIDVEMKVFTAINNYRMSSMTPQGQCRLAPLITLIQDSNPLYDMCVRIMFKLHDRLPNDLLVGHRERFRELFIKLKQFYDNARPLQYFADLIQVPHLPDHAPNFQSQVDLGTYIPPVVMVQPDPEPVMEQLIDMDNNSSSQSTHNSANELNSMPIPDEMTLLEQTLQQREQQFQKLQHDLARTRDALRSMEEKYQSETKLLRQGSSILSDDLAATREVCIDLKKENKILSEKLAEKTATLAQEAEALEKAKASEEKFNKLKTMYAQIRDEHIQLLRQQGECNKSLRTEKQEKEKLLAEIERMRNDELTRLKVLDAEKQNFEKELEQTRLKNDELQQQIATLKSQQEQLSINHERELNELLQQNQKLAAERELSNQTKTQQQQQLEIKCTALNADLLKLEKELTAQMKEMDKELSTAKSEATQLNLQQQNLQAENLNLQATLKDTQQQIANLQTQEKQQADFINSLLLSVYENVLKGVQHTQLNSQNSCYTQALEIVKQMQSLMPEFSAAAQQPAKLAGLVVLMGQQFSQLMLQGAYINSSSADIETAQTVHDKIGDMWRNVEQFCGGLKGSGEFAEQPLKQLSLQLTELQAPLERLKATAAAKTDLGDLVVNELAEMDKTIAEATNRFVELLSQTRSQDEGIKLEVNGKILDACTALMECLKQLIERARQLQEEIVSIGRGSASVKEFYKRNSQWSEGLISAAKSVARGANVLFDAADKATSVEQPNAREYFHILVAAQEIAAYTVQLVVASKVKAPKNSERLSALQQASRSVSNATGAVVATVRDCNKFLETPEPIDITKLTSSQAKTMEMEIHVRVLELEQALQMQRLKLSAFRRNNYQNTED